MTSFSQHRDLLKYKRIKRHVKRMIFLNAAVCDEISRIECKMAQVRLERKVLLKQLLASHMRMHLPEAKVQQNVSVHQPSNSCAKVLVSEELPKNKRKPNPVAQTSKKTKKVPQSKELAPGKSVKGKAKRSTGKRSVVPLPLDATGKPVYPVEIGPVTLYNLGEVITEQPAFHSVYSFYPVGYCSTRKFISMRNIENPVMFTCKISEVDNAPRFEICPEDSPYHVFSGSSPSEAHSAMIACINKVHSLSLNPTSSSGVDFFGLSLPGIQHLIQTYAGSRSCSDYKWVTFDVTSSSAAEECQPTDPTVSVDVLLNTDSSRQHDSLASLRSLLTSSSAQQY